MVCFGLFGNYNRPGPGVSKDEAPKPAPVRFFQILGRKFGKLVQLNLLFLIPVVIISIIMFGLYIVPIPKYQMSMRVGGHILQMNLWDKFVVPLPLILLSPFVAGVTYVTRNYAREEHAFVYSDFKDAVKSNWKYFLINGALCYLVYALLSVAISYYSRLVSNWVMCIPLGLCFLITVLFLFGQYYVPMLIVTVDLKLKQIYHNAFILSVIGLGRNVLLTLIYAALIILGIVVAPMMGLTMLIGIFFVLFLLFSFCSYLDSFMVYPLVEKYMIRPYYEAKQKTESLKNGGEEVLSDEIKETLKEVENENNEDEEDSKPEYVYVNGRLIKRKETEDDSVFEDKT